MLLLKRVLFLLVPLMLTWPGVGQALNFCTGLLTASDHIVDRLELRQLALRPRHIPSRWVKMAMHHPIFKGIPQPSLERPDPQALAQNLEELSKVLDWVAIHGVRLTEAAKDLLIRTSLGLAALHWEQNGVKFNFKKDQLATYPSNFFPWSLELDPATQDSSANRVAAHLEKTSLGLKLSYFPGILLATRSDACYYMKNHKIFVSHNFVVRPTIKEIGLMHELRHARTMVYLAQKKDYPWYGSVLNTKEIIAGSKVPVLSSYRNYFTFDEVLAHYYDLRIELRQVRRLLQDRATRALGYLKYRSFLGILDDTIALAMDAKSYLQLAANTMREHPERILFNQVGPVVMSLVDLSLIPEMAADQMVHLLIPIVRPLPGNDPANLALLAQQIQANQLAIERVLGHVVNLAQMVSMWMLKSSRLNPTAISEALALLPKME